VSSRRRKLARLRKDCTGCLLRATTDGPASAEPGPLRTAFWRWRMFYLIYEICWWICFLGSFGLMWFCIATRNGAAAIACGFFALISFVYGVLDLDTKV